MTGGGKGFWFHDPIGRFDRLDADAARRAILAASAGRWRWLEEVRARLDCAIELLDVELGYLLDPPSDSRSAIDLRALLTPHDASTRDALIGVARSTRPAAITVRDIRIRLFPLVVRSRAQSLTVALLAIATRDLSGADRRLDGVADWLLPAVEASLLTGMASADELRSASAFVAMFDLLGELIISDDDDQMLRLTMEAIALWYDADVRLYRQDVLGAFTLHASLPGAVVAPAELHVPGHNVWARDELFSMDSSFEILDEPWPDVPGLTRVVPITIDDSVEWLIAITGGAIDASARVPLAVLGRVIGSRLTNLHGDVVDRMRRGLTTTFGFGDAPFDATAQIVLDRIASEIDASEARAAIYYGNEPTPVLTLGTGGPADVRPVEAGSALVSGDRISVGVLVNAGVTLVLDVSRQVSPFGPGAARLTREAAALLAIWVSGILVKAGQLPVRADVQTAGDFADRAAAFTDRLGRLSVSGAVVVFVPEAGSVTGPLIDETMEILRERLRPTDTVGVIQAAGAAVLLPDVTPAIAGSVVVRLLQAARRRGLDSARVGLATFAAAAETVGSVINRALMNAGGTASKA